MLHQCPAKGFTFPSIFFYLLFSNQFATFLYESLKWRFLGLVFFGAEGEKKERLWRGFDPAPPLSLSLSLSSAFLMGVKGKIRRTCSSPSIQM